MLKCIRTPSFINSCNEELVTHNLLVIYILKECVNGFSELF